MKSFKREEKKYLISKEKYKKLLNIISKYLEKDQYFKETICNIYFDNENSDLVISSIEKPLYKEKIRLRSYNIPNLNDNVFFEIKKKYKGITNKRRVVISLKKVYEYLENGLLPCDDQIMKEIDYCFKMYKLKPALYLAYERESYLSKTSPDLRITFDNNIRSRNENLRLELGSEGTYLIEDNYIMEVKSLKGMPSWLLKAFSELEIYPTSFSKYGVIYKNMKGAKLNV